MNQIPTDPSSADERTAIRARVQAQFAPAAGNYVTSTTHAYGVDLARLVELAAPRGTEHLLDVATGGGHTALAFAPHVRSVVASDLTLAMLQAARQHIAAQGITNVTFCRAIAEALPFSSAGFDLVTCRVAAHHFADAAAFAAEAARVLRPGGRLLISDHIGLEDPELDAFMDRFERWRDPGHVRAYTYAEWSNFFAGTGLQIEHTESDPREPYEFDSWTARLRMPAAEREALERWLLAAPPHIREVFAIVVENGRVVSLRGHFGIIVARKHKRLSG
jgi:ubiquinone/menaquinone biosynthesis C-methylase UbiE